jgi:zinc/manganese transport system permease protein
VNVDLLLDPLFRTPFAVGLLLACVLPLLGVVLRLRNEWLAALGLAHLAGASGLMGLAAGIPVILGAPLGALAGALAKGLGRFSGNTVYAVMILLGWATTLLIAANTSLGSVMGHALVEGQLYFVSGVHLAAASILALLTAIALPWLLPRLIRAQLFPGYELSNRLPAWQWHMGFDVLAALAMAVGAGCLGLMAAFALVFVPPWIAFRVSCHWRQALLISVVSGVLGYIAAFIAALLFDQPFAPVLVTSMLLIAGVLRLLSARP